MPIASVSLKKDITRQYHLILVLEEKCKLWKLFVGKEAEQTFIYSVSNPIPPKYDTMVAISKYGKTYAMLTPDDLTQEELVIFEFALREIDPDEEIVVFSRRDYNAAKKYLYGKKNKVRLYS